MIIKTYNLTADNRERLAQWVYINHKPAGAANMDDEVLRERAAHAARACGDSCPVCRQYAPTWALAEANNSADNFEGYGHVELSQFETYSGHAEVIEFSRVDYDVTEEGVD